jgi:prephenate dehydrogenase
MKITHHSTIGIIGGHGRTGRQFASLFRRLKFPVIVTGSRDAEKNAEIVRTCDIVLFAVPLILASNIIAHELRGARRKDQLILDVSSLKVREVRAMLKAKGEVIGMHPLFGPATDPRGETVILCPARATKETLTTLRSILGAMGLKTVIMTPDAHDRLMAVVQVIPHLKSLLMAEVMRDLKVDFRRVLATCTPTYELEFNVIGRFLDDHPGLYMPIIFRNPYAKKILASLKRTIASFSSIAATENLPAAEKHYAASKKYFTPYLKRARSHSEACIRTLLSLSR